MVERRTEQETRSSGPGLRMGRPFGIPVYISPTWFVIAALIAFIFHGAIVTKYLPGLGPIGYLVSLVFAVLLYGSVLLHELAHALVARWYGFPVRRITLYMLGGYTEIEREPDAPGKEFAVAFAGPLVSLLLAAGGGAVWAFLDQTSVVGVLVFQLLSANLLVGVFNLLPGLPLDGGRLLRAAVWKLSGSPASGTITAAWVGRGLAVMVAALPLLLALIARQPVDFVLMVWAVLLAAFIWLGASQSLRMARVRERIPHVRARTLARRALPVTGDVPLAEALRRANEAQAGAMVVVDHEHRPIALVSELAVNGTPEHRRPWVMVGTVARTLEPELVISADLEGDRLLDAMRQIPSEEYLLVEEGGEVYGVLSTADVNRAFAGV